MIALIDFGLSFGAIAVFCLVVVSRVAVDKPLRFLGVVIVRERDWTGRALELAHARQRAAFWLEECRHRGEECARLYVKAHTLEKARTIIVKPVAMGVDSGIRIEVGQ